MAYLNRRATLLIEDAGGTSQAVAMQLDYLNKYFNSMYVDDYNRDPGDPDESDGYYMETMLSQLAAAVGAAEDEEEKAEYTRQHQELYPEYLAIFQCQHVLRAAAAPPLRVSPFAQGYTDDPVRLDESDKAELNARLQFIRALTMVFPKLLFVKYESISDALSDEANEAAVQAILNDDEAALAITRTVPGSRAMALMRVHTAVREQLKAHKQRDDQVAPPEINTTYREYVGKVSEQAFGALVLNSSAVKTALADMVADYMRTTFLPKDAHYSWEVGFIVDRVAPDVFVKYTPEYDAAISQADADEAAQRRWPEVQLFASPCVDFLGLRNEDEIWSPATTLAQLQQAARALNNVRDTHNLRAFTVPNGSTPSIRKTQRELADFITKFVHSTKRATVARAIFSLSRAACVGDAGGDALDKQVLPLFTFNDVWCTKDLPEPPAAKLSLRDYRRSEYPEHVHSRASGRAAVRAKVDSISTNEVDDVVEHLKAVGELLYKTGQRLHGGHDNNALAMVGDKIRTHGLMCMRDAMSATASDAEPATPDEREARVTHLVDMLSKLETMAGLPPVVPMFPPPAVPPPPPKIPGLTVRVDADLNTTRLFTNLDSDASASAMVVGNVAAINPRVPFAKTSAVVDFGINTTPGMLYSIQQGEAEDGQQPVLVQSPTGHPFETLVEGSREVGGRDQRIAKIEFRFPGAERRRGSLVTGEVTVNLDSPFDVNIDSPYIQCTAAPSVVEIGGRKFSFLRVAMVVINDAFLSSDQYDMVSQIQDSPSTVPAAEPLGGAGDPAAAEPEREEVGLVLSGAVLPRLLATTPDLARVDESARVVADVLRVSGDPVDAGDGDDGAAAAAGGPRGGEGRLAPGDELLQVRLLYTMSRALRTREATIQQIERAWRLRLNAELEDANVVKDTLITLLNSNEKTVARVPHDVAAEMVRIVRDITYHAFTELFVAPSNVENVINRLISSRRSHRFFFLRVTGSLAPTDVARLVHACDGHECRLVLVRTPHVDYCLRVVDGAQSSSMISVDSREAAGRAWEIVAYESAETRDPTMDRAMRRVDRLMDGEPPVITASADMRRHWLRMRAASVAVERHGVTRATGWIGVLNEFRKVANGSKLLLLACEDTGVVMTELVRRRDTGVTSMRSTDMEEWDEWLTAPPPPVAADADGVMQCFAVMDAHLMSNKSKDQMVRKASELDGPRRCKIIFVSARTSPSDLSLAHQHASEHDQATGAYVVHVSVGASALKSMGLTDATSGRLDRARVLAAKMVFGAALSLSPAGMASLASMDTLAKTVTAASEGLVSQRVAELAADTLLSCKLAPVADLKKLEDCKLDDFVKRLCQWAVRRAYDADNKAEELMPFDWFVHNNPACQLLPQRARIASWIHEVFVLHYGTGVVLASRPDAPEGKASTVAALTAVPSRGLNVHTRHLLTYLAADLARDAGVSRCGYVCSQQNTLARGDEFRLSQALAGHEMRWHELRSNVAFPSKLETLLELCAVAYPLKLLAAVNPATLHAVLAALPPLENPLVRSMLLQFAVALADDVTYDLLGHGTELASTLAVLRWKLMIDGTVDSLVENVRDHLGAAAGARVEPRLRFRDQDLRVLIWIQGVNLDIPSNDNMNDLCEKLRSMDMPGRQGFIAGQSELRARLLSTDCRAECVETLVGGDAAIIGSLVVDFLLDADGTGDSDAPVLTHAAAVHLQNFVNNKPDVVQVEPDAALAVAHPAERALYRAMTPNALAVMATAATSSNAATWVAKAALWKLRQEPLDADVETLRSKYVQPLLDINVLKSDYGVTMLETLARAAPPAEGDNIVSRTLQAQYDAQVPSAEEDTSLEVGFALFKVVRSDLVGAVDTTKHLDEAVSTCSDHSFTFPLRGSGITNQHCRRIWVASKNVLQYGEWKTGGAVGLEWVSPIISTFGATPLTVQETGRTVWLHVKNDLPADARGRNGTHRSLELLLWLLNPYIGGPTADIELPTAEEFGFVLRVASVPDVGFMRRVSEQWRNAAPFALFVARQLGMTSPDPLPTSVILSYLEVYNQHAHAQLTTQAPKFSVTVVDRGAGGGELSWEVEPLMHVASRPLHGPTARKLDNEITEWIRRENDVDLTNEVSALPGTDLDDLDKIRLDLNQGVSVSAVKTNLRSLLVSAYRIRFHNHVRIAMLAEEKWVDDEADDAHKAEVRGAKALLLAGRVKYKANDLPRSLVAWTTIWAWFRAANLHDRAWRWARELARKAPLIELCSGDCTAELPAPENHIVNTPAGREVYRYRECPNCHRVASIKKTTAAGDAPVNDDGGVAPALTGFTQPRNLVDLFRDRPGGMPVEDAVDVAPPAAPRELYEQERRLKPMELVAQYSSFYEMPWWIYNNVDMAAVDGGRDAAEVPDAQDMAMRLTAISNDLIDYSLNVPVRMDLRDATDAFWSNFTLFGRHSEQQTRWHLDLTLPPACPRVGDETTITDDPATGRAHMEALGRHIVDAHLWPSNVFNADLRDGPVGDRVGSRTRVALAPIAEWDRLENALLMFTHVLSVAPHQPRGGQPSVRQVLLRFFLDAVREQLDASIAGAAGAAAAAGAGAGGPRRGTSKQYQAFLHAVMDSQSLFSAQLRNDIIDACAPLDGRVGFAVDALAFHVRLQEHFLNRHPGDPPEATAESWTGNLHVLRDVPVPHPLVFKNVFDYLVRAEPGILAAGRGAAQRADAAATAEAQGRDGTLEPAALLLDSPEKAVKEGGEVDAHETLGGSSKPRRKHAVVDCSQLIAVEVHAGALEVKLLPGREIMLMEITEDMFALWTKDPDADDAAAAAEPVAAAPLAPPPLVRHMSYDVRHKDTQELRIPWKEVLQPVHKKEPLATFQDHEQAWEAVQSLAQHMCIVVDGMVLSSDRTAGRTSWRPYLPLAEVRAGFTYLPSVKFWHLLDAVGVLAADLPDDVHDMLHLCAEAVYSRYRAKHRPALPAPHELAGAKQNQPAAVLSALRSLGRDQIASTELEKIGSGVFHFMQILLYRLDKTVRAPHHVGGREHVRLIEVAMLQALQSLDNGGMREKLDLEDEATQLSDKYGADIFVEHPHYEPTTNEDFSESSADKGREGARALAPFMRPSKNLRFKRLLAGLRARGYRRAVQAFLAAGNRTGWEQSPCLPFVFSLVFTVKFHRRGQSLLAEVLRVPVAARNLPDDTSLNNRHTEIKDEFTRAIAVDVRDATNSEVQGRALALAVAREKLAEMEQQGRDDQELYDAVEAAEEAVRSFKAAHDINIDKLNAATLADARAAARSSLFRPVDDVHARVPEYVDSARDVDDALAFEGGAVGAAAADGAAARAGAGAAAAADGAAAAAADGAQAAQDSQTKRRLRAPGYREKYEPDWRFTAGSLSGRQCVQLQFVPLSEDNPYRASSGQTLCFVTHVDVLGSTWAAGDAADDSALRDRTRREGMNEWVRDVLRAPLRWSFKEAILWIAHRSADVLARELTPVATPDETVVVNCLARRCGNPDDAQAQLAATAVSNLYVDMKTRCESGRQVNFSAVGATHVQFWPGDGIKFWYLQREGGARADQYGMRVVPKHSVMEPHVEEVLAFANVRWKVVSTSQDVMEQGSRDAKVYMEINRAFADHQCCFVVVKGITTRPSDVLMKWCAEYTQRNPWAFIFWEDTQIGWLLPEIIDRFVKDDVFKEQIGKLEGTDVEFPAKGRQVPYLPPRPMLRLRKTNVISRWEPKLTLDDLSLFSWVLVDGAPGIGKTYHIQRNIMPEFEQAGGVATRIDGSNDEFTRTTITDRLSQLVVPDREVLVVVDEYHMMSAELKRQLVEWFAKQSNVKLIMISNRIDQADEALFRDVFTSMRAEDTANAGAGDSAAEAGPPLDTIDEHIIRARGSVDKCLESIIIRNHILRNAQFAGASLHGSPVPRTQNVADVLLLSYVWVHTMTALLGPSMLSLRRFGSNVRHGGNQTCPLLSPESCTPQDLVDYLERYMPYLGPDFIGDICSAVWRTYNGMKADNDKLWVRANAMVCSEFTSLMAAREAAAPGSAFVTTGLFPAASESDYAVPRSALDAVIYDGLEPEGAVLDTAHASDIWDGILQKVRGDAERGIPARPSLLTLFRVHIALMKRHCAMKAAERFREWRDGAHPAPLAAAAGMGPGDAMADTLVAIALSDPSANGCSYPEYMQLTRGGMYQPFFHHPLKRIAAWVTYREARMPDDGVDEPDTRTTGWPERYEDTQGADVDDRDDTATEVTPETVHQDTDASFLALGASAAAANTMDEELRTVYDAALKDLCAAYSVTDHPMRFPVLRHDGAPVSPDSLSHGPVATTRVDEWDMLQIITALRRGFAVDWVKVAEHWSTHQITDWRLFSQLLSVRPGAYALRSMLTGAKGHDHTEGAVNKLLDNVRRLLELGRGRDGVALARQCVQLEDFRDEARPAHELATMPSWASFVAAWKLYRFSELKAVKNIQWGADDNFAVWHTTHELGSNNLDRLCVFLLWVAKNGGNSMTVLDHSRQRCLVMVVHMLIATRYATEKMRGRRRKEESRWWVQFVRTLWGGTLGKWLPEPGTERALLRHVYFGDGDTGAVEQPLVEMTLPPGMTPDELRVPAQVYVLLATAPKYNASWPAEVRTLRSLLGPSAVAAEVESPAVSKVLESFLDVQAAGDDDGGAAAPAGGGAADLDDLFWPKIFPQYQNDSTPTKLLRAVLRVHDGSALSLNVQRSLLSTDFSSKDLREAPRNGAGARLDENRKNFNTQEFAMKFMHVARIAARRDDLVLGKKKMATHPDATFNGALRRIWGAANEAAP